MCYEKYFWNTPVLKFGSYLIVKSHKLDRGFEFLRDFKNFFSIYLEWVSFCVSCWTLKKIEWNYRNEKCSRNKPLKSLSSYQALICSKIVDRLDRCLNQTHYQSKLTENSIAINWSYQSCQIGFSFFFTLCFEGNIIAEDDFIYFSDIFW